MKSPNPLDSIIMISVPENFQFSSSDISLDPSILLPVEIPSGISPEDWNMEDLSWEMILSGMLKLLAYDPGNENNGYYRNFILHVKPAIIQELTQSGIVKAQTKEFDLAEEIFRALIGLEPFNYRHRLNLTILFENRANHLELLEKNDDSSYYRDLAEDSYMEIIDQGDSLPDIFFNGACFFYNKQDFVKASELADSYLKFGDDEVKIAEAKKILNDSDNIKSQNQSYNKAYTLIRNDQNQEGLKEIDDFLNHNPDVWNAWFIKGWALRKMEKFEEALQAFSKAKELNGAQLDIYNELAICHIELKQYSEAESSLHRAFEIDPENLKVISNMGILSLKQGKNKEAEGFFRTVLDLEPDDPIALEYLNFLKNDQNN